MFDIDELERAAEVVHKVLPETPQIRWPLLCRRVETNVWVKQENHTPIGSFKIRGALFYVSELQRKYPEVGGVIAATRGNFGQSVTFAGVGAGLKTVIVVPHGNGVYRIGRRFRPERPLELSPGFSLGDVIFTR
jgi:threonine dehydratase